MVTTDSWHNVPEKERSKNMEKKEKKERQKEEKREWVGETIF
jgi:hypothetical protein